MSKLCRHEGEKVLDGKSTRSLDTRLRFCLICGEPIVETVLDVAAYIAKPRTVVNGKVVPRNLTIFGKIDFILDNVRALTTFFVRPRGRPQKEEEISEIELAIPQDKFELLREFGIEKDDGGERKFEPTFIFPEEFGKGRMPGRTFVRLIYWSGRFYEVLNFNFKRCLDYANSFGVIIDEDVINFLEILAKANLKLGEKEIKALTACSMIKQGGTLTDAARLCHVKPETVKTWRQYVKAASRKTAQFKNLTDWPPFVGFTITAKDGKILRVEPSILKNDKPPKWVLEWFRKFKNKP